MRGFHDIAPESSKIRGYLADIFYQSAHSLGFDEIHFPVVESLDLFQRSVGNNTDIVNKEMYTLEDRNGTLLALRPEGTAGCVRAALALGLIHNTVQRLYYQGPMFRYERPQKGRLRQFHQIGLETFGLQSPVAELELIQLMNHIWKQLGIHEEVHLHLNYLGGAETQNNYQKALKDYLTPHASNLDEDSQQRLNHNVLRILDSKNTQTQEILLSAPKLIEFYSDDEHDLIEKTLESLHRAHIDAVFDPMIVRGLDYYTGIVFEWMTDKLGAQGTLCAGGRYDGLVEQLGGKPTPAVGLSAGVERIEALLSLKNNPQPETNCDLYIGISGDDTYHWLFPYLNQLQTLNLNIRQGSSLSGIKAHLKAANKISAKYCLLAGEDELSHNKVVLKNMTSGVQIDLAPEEILNPFKPTPKDSL